MILVDSNIPMYVVGADHPNKAAALGLLEQAVSRGERLVTDVEVMQEILHRYAAIDRIEAVQPAFDLLLAVVDETLPIELDDVQSAKHVLLGGYQVSARDALHIAIMQRHQIDTVMTFDRGFDRYPGLNRVG